MVSQSMADDIFSVHNINTFFTFKFVASECED
jgi:hypothetical protein